MKIKEIIVTKQSRFEDLKKAIEFAKTGGVKEIRMITNKGDVLVNNPEDLNKYLPKEPVK
jgi:hypothetical protein